MSNSRVEAEITPVEPPVDYSPLQGLTVGLSYNLKGAVSVADDEAEYDSIETIDFLQEQLTRLGLTVVRLEQNDALAELLKAVRPRYVMNIAEGKGSSRLRESQIPCLLDSFGIPYYGSDGLALGITLDKWLTHKYLKASAIPVAQLYMVKSLSEVGQIAGISSRSPYIVKPRWEGSSKGIFANSVVDSLPACQDRVGEILAAYKQPALVEEFLPGDEITVGLIGNQAVEVVGMMRISERHPKERFIYCLDNKRDWREQIKYERAADVLDPAILAQVRRYAIEAFRALELRDIARIDFRLNAHGVPHIIDVNPLPGLSPEYSDFMLMSQLHGRDFPDVVRRVITISLQRTRLLAGVS